MRCLLITNDFYPNNIGGMTSYYTELVKALASENLFVLTVAAEKTDILEPCEVVRATVKNSDSGRFLNKRKMKKEAFRLVHEKKINLVLCGNISAYGSVVFDIYKSFNVPYYVFFHGNDLLRVLDRMDRFLLKRFTYGRIFRGAEGFIANSRFVMERVPDRFVHGKNLVVLNPGVGKDFENLPVEKPFRENGKIRLLSVCRLDPRKGILQVIEAVALLKDRYPGLVYDVVGDGNTAAYMSRVKALGLENRVFFHGFREQNEVMGFFRSCDVFIMVSSASVEKKDVEGFGIVYLEANAFGKPVIGSDTGGIPDAVVDGVTGRLVKNPFDTVEIAEKISWMCDNQDTSCEMGEAGHKRVNTLFKYKVLAERLKASLQPSVKKSDLLITGCKKKVRVCFGEKPLCDDSFK